MTVFTVVAALVMQAPADPGPPRTPPPPRATAQQLMEQLKVRADTLKPPRAATMPQIAPTAPPLAAALAGPPDELPRTAAPRRKYLEELLVEIEGRPEGKKLIDSLRRAGVLRTAPPARPPVDEMTPEPNGSEGTAEESLPPLMSLQTTAPVAVITPAAPMVGMAADYQPTGAGSGLALLRIMPAIHRFDTRDYWAVRVEYLCRWAPSTLSELGRKYPTVWTTSVAAIATSQTGLLSSIVPYMYLPLAPSLSDDPRPCNAAGETRNAAVGTIQPEISVAAVNLSPGTYLINLRGWGAHTVAPPEEPQLVSVAWQNGGRSWAPTVGAISLKQVIAKTTSGWQDYATVITVPSSAPGPGQLKPLQYHFTYKVLGPVGVTLYVSEIALYKIG